MKSDDAIKLYYEEHPYLPSEEDLRDDKFEKILNLIIEDKIIQKLHLIKMLDVGCGNGFMSSYIKKKSEYPLELHGIDFAQSQVDIAKKAGVHAIQHDITKPFPYPNKFFDVILCSDVLEHLFLPEDCIKNSFKVLKDEGIAIFTVPNYAALQIRLTLLLKGHSRLIDYAENKEHIRFYNKKTIVNLLEKEGFFIDKIAGSSFFEKIPVTIAYHLSKIFPALSLGLIIKCRRNSGEKCQKTK